MPKACVCQIHRHPRWRGWGRHCQDQPCLELFLCNQKYVSNHPFGKNNGKDLPSEHDNTRTDELRKRQCHTNVQSREGLQQDHAQADTLDSIKDTKPEPRADTDVRTGAPTPWKIETHAGGTPPHLTPSRTPETNGENGKKPRVNLGITCGCVLDTFCHGKQPNLRIRIPRRRPQIPTKKMAIMMTTAHLGTPA